MPNWISLPTSSRTARRHASIGALCSKSAIATDVSATQNSREGAGFFQAAATAAPGCALPDLSRAIVEEVERLARDGPTPGRARSLPRTGGGAIHFSPADGGRLRRKVRSAECVQRRSCAIPAFFDRDLARYQNVTAESLRRTVQTYLANDRRVVLSVVPQGRTELALPGSVTAIVS